MTPLGTPVLFFPTFEFPGTKLAGQHNSLGGGSSTEATNVAWGIRNFQGGDGGTLVGAGLEQGDSLGPPLSNMLHSTCWPFLPCAICTVGCFSSVGRNIGPGSN